MPLILASLHQHIEVRLAKEGELISLLDGQEVKLNSNTLVIADSKQAHAIAGVMGGNYSGVSDTTSDVFLESAFFAPLTVAYAQSIMVFSQNQPIGLNVVLILICKFPLLNARLNCC